ncbi:hypothetical protein CO615_04400 [Lysobacteraceae bacterium NML75-0749]|nr:hypothetical protein CO615_04400 [Xanthomonadaceae bacterium NML75-0749]
MSISRLTLLPYLPHIAAGLLVAALLCAAGGAWLGQKLARGTAARAANTALKTEITDLRSQLAQQTRQHTELITAMHYARLRMDEVAKQLEIERHEIDILARQQSQALRNLGTRRPEIRQPLPAAVGADLLCHWNRAKTAPGTDTATAAIPGCEPDATLPTAPNAGGGDAGGDAGRPRPNDTPVPRVPGAAIPAGSGRAGDAGGRAGVVLPGTQTLGHPGGVQ